jgi:hypothetical protein
MTKTPAPAVIPVVGMPATRHYKNIHNRESFMTAQPMVIIKVSKSGKTIKLESLNRVSGLTGHTPAYTVNGEKQWSHLYTAEEVRRLAFSEPITYDARLREDGNWVILKRKEILSLGFALYSAKEKVL